MLADFLFPRECLGCGQTGNYFCEHCLNKLLLQPQRICPICSQFSPGGFVHPGCQQSLGLNGLTTVFQYKGIFKKAIKKLKYKFITDLAGNLVESFLSFCGEDKTFTQFCRQTNVFLVPIPLHPSRRRWRGFNQAELLGKMIAENLALPFQPNLLLRKKKTKPQVKLSKDERAENIKGAFILNGNLKLEIKNLKFIIFDDVWTSGATMREAARVLKRSGAQKVWGLALAR